MSAEFVVALRKRNFLNVSFTSSPISHTLVPYEHKMVIFCPFCLCMILFTSIVTNHKLIKIINNISS